MRIEKINNKLTGASKETLKKEVRKLEDGAYDLTIRKLPDGYHPTRYKYYFDVVASFALPVAKKYCFWETPGGLKPVETRDELHEFWKLMYNPLKWVNKATGEVGIRGGSTTLLSDRDFITEYMDYIIAEYSSPPFCVEFITYDEWKDLHKRGVWYDFKSEYMARSIYGG